MTPSTTDEPTPDAKYLGRSKAPKLFPLLSFKEALLLPTRILEYGINGEIKRLTLLSKIGKSPNSSSTRAWITGSSKYGLTSGSYAASSLAVTEAGRAASTAASTGEKTPGMFDLAIRRFGPFGKLHEKLTGQRLPDETVLRDELARTGIQHDDCERAATVFVANLRYLGLVRPVKDADYVISVDEAMEQIPVPASNNAPTTVGESANVGSRTQSDQTADVKGMQGVQGVQGVQPRGPSLHIDVQIHIDASASTEQIDQIFSSMARHLYGRSG